MYHFLPEFVLVVEVLHRMMINVPQGLLCDEVVPVNVLRRKHKEKGHFRVYFVVRFNAQNVAALLVKVHLNRGVVLSHHPKVIENWQQLFSVS